MQVTRLGTRHNAQPVIKDNDPRGRPIFWIGLPGPESDAGPGTDFYAVSEGYVSITPLHLDMTNYKMFDRLSNWLNGICIGNT
jgi:5'-nucleotidase